MLRKIVLTVVILFLMNLSSSLADGNHGGHSNTGTKPLSGSHHSQEQVIETPPNYAVLWTFGTINAVFILYGVFQKYVLARVVNQ